MDVKSIGNRFEVPTLLCVLDLLLENCNFTGVGIDSIHDFIREVVDIALFVVFCNEVLKMRSSRPYIQWLLDVNGSIDLLIYVYIGAFLLNPRRNPSWCLLAEALLQSAPISDLERNFIISRLTKVRACVCELLYIWSKLRKVW